MNAHGALFLLLLAAAGVGAETARFASVELTDERTRLLISRTDGSVVAAPMQVDQDSFDKPAISADGGYAGWLALYPNRGASYSQPLGLVVLDARNHTHHFAGTFGMVFEWCFAPGADAVVYTYSFPHGRTPTGFDMRRIKDERLLHRAIVEPKLTSAGVQEVDAAVPHWANCLHTASAR